MKFRYFSVIATVIFSLSMAASSYAQSSWKPLTGGPFEGAVAASAAFHNAFFVATPTGAFFRSSDGGATFSASAQPVAATKAPRLNATADGLFASYLPGLYFSPDGNVWRTIETGPVDTSIFCIYTTGHVWIAGVFGGIIRSTDSGKSWSKSSQLVVSVTGILSYSNSLIASTNVGLYRSTDSGETWKLALGASSSVQSMTTDGQYLYETGSLGVSTVADTLGGLRKLRTATLGSLSVSSIVYNGTTLFAIVGPTSSIPAMWRSDDGARTWQQVAHEPQTQASTDAVRTLSVLGSTVIAGSDHTTIYRSSDNGITWRQTGLPGNLMTVHQLGAHGSHLFALSYYSGIGVSSDSGLTWRDENDGLRDLVLHGFTSIGDRVVIGSATVFWSMDGNSIVWSAASTTTHGTAALFRNDSILYAGGAVNSDIYRSTDSGTNWRQVFSGGIAAGSINSFARISGHLFAADGERGLLLSTDNGFNWSPFASPFDLKDVRVLFSKGVTLFAGVSGKGLFRSLDSGSTWSYLSFDLFSPYALDTLGDNLYAAIYGQGVYVSRDNGTTWRARSQGLVSMKVQSLVHLGQTLFASFLDGPIYKLDSADEMASVSNQSQSNNLIISSIYPNPSHGSSAMSITVESPSRMLVTTEVIDELGRVISTSHRMIAQGSSALSIDAPLRAGVYFVRIASQHGSALRAFTVEK